MLGVNFQWDAVESEFGEQTIHLISMLSAEGIASLLA